MLLNTLLLPNLRCILSVPLSNSIEPPLRCMVTEQILHGGQDLVLGNLSHELEFYGISGDPVLFRYTIKGIGIATPPEVRECDKAGPCSTYDATAPWYRQTAPAVGCYPRIFVWQCHRECLSHFGKTRLVASVYAEAFVRF